MKKFLIALAVVGLIGCSEEVPPPPPEPTAQQPDGGSAGGAGNKWGQNFEPAVKACGNYYASQFRWDPASKWEAACRCLYTVAASRWDYSEFYYNGYRYEQELAKEGVQTRCLKEAGLEQYAY